jgi:hypothetical protein
VCDESLARDVHFLKIYPLIIMIKKNSIAVMVNNLRAGRNEGFFGFMPY